MRWFLVLLVAGCVRSSTVECGDRICAEGTVCRLVTDPDAHLCVTQAQIDACLDPPTDGTCTLAGLASARCYDGVCIAAGCGNLRVDPGERCDDGNQAAADGCSADCTSNEVCGNRAVDTVQGEQCDDGNRTSGDGCTSTCRIEQVVWQQITVDRPQHRERAGFAYDRLRQVTVMFGGRRTIAGGDLETDETWVWNGLAWRRALPQTSPPAREGPAMAYDPTRDRIVMFGGRTQGIDLGDTWEWDGSTWTLRDTPVEPGRRADHAMTYDGRRKRVAMFGGDAYGFAFADVWEWDGATWSTQAAGVRPSARTQAVFVFDPALGVSLAFGGRTADSTVAFGDTWEWNGTAWRLADDDPALARPGAAAAFDLTRQGVVVTGGKPFGGQALTDTLSWSGTAWQLISTTGRPRRAGHMVASDVERKRLVEFGGRDDQGSLTSLTLELAASGWDVIQQGSLTPRYGMAGAYDDVRRRGVFFGGVDNGVSPAALGDTWEVTGGAAARVALTGPPNRQLAAMAYDSARGEILLFGGLPSSSPAALQDTWTWNGSAWTQRTPVTMPPPRFGHAMAFDRKRGRVVMFGGSSGSPVSSVLDETWEWDGTTWIRQTPPASPPARRGAALAYDPVAEEIVMFGGEAPSGVSGTVGYLGDTWVWSGSAWTQKQPAAKPSTRGYAALAYASNRRRLVLVGGRHNVNSVVNDAWEWNGATWQRLAVPSTPPARYGHVLVPNDDGSGVIAIAGAQLDGTGQSRPLADVWRLSWSSVVPTEICYDDRDLDGDTLGGCGDPDCWFACSPLCPPGTSCPASVPTCGDQRCDAFESCRLCPGDCGACPAVCGDNVCSPGEACLGDC